MLDVPPRRFHLVRRREVPGVSDPGVVAEGALWSSGALSLHWPACPNPTSAWAGFSDLLAARENGSQVEVQWIDWPGEQGGRVVPLPDRPYDPRD